MLIVCEALVGEETAELAPLLSEADESAERISAALASTDKTAYAARLGARLVGAAVLGWSQADSELIYLAVAPELRGQGVGKQIISYLKAELIRRQGAAMLVGTANAALDNIAFYQKCGFRMFEIRRDFFDYIQPPVYENGIRLLDMLVFRYCPAEDSPLGSARGAP